jgi:HPt (histidine-containing phosphotransfer) domain-containing protein
MSTAFQYLDLERATRYLGDRPSVMALLATLIESLQQELPRLDALVAAGDVAGANRLLHQIKGYTPIFCTTLLTGPVAQIENLSKQCTAQELQGSFRSVAPVLQGLLEEVRQCIANAGATTS